MTEKTTPPNFQEVTFLIWTNGDPSTGIPGAQAEATITLDVNEPEDLAHTKECLKLGFGRLWDFPVFVMTQTEYDADEAAARKAEEEQDA